MDEVARFALVHILRLLRFWQSPSSVGVHADICAVFWETFGFRMSSQTLKTRCAPA